MQVRVQNSFNARVSVVHAKFRLLSLFKITFFRACDSRKYTYYFPSYLLLPPKPGSGLDRVLTEHNASLSLDLGNPAEDSNPASFWKDAENLPHDEELARKRAWRVPSILVEKLRQIARAYEGTHNFHNFTVGRDFNDRTNQRYMKKIEVRTAAL